MYYYIIMRWNLDKGNLHIKFSDAPIIEDNLSIMDIMGSSKCVNIQRFHLAGFLLGGRGDS